MSQTFGGKTITVNRLQAAANRYEAKIERFIAEGRDNSGRPCTRESIDKLSLADSDFEVMGMQTQQAYVFAAGGISEEEARWLYHNLGGETPSKTHFNALPVSVRITILQVMAELLGR